ncbi:DUF4397 domain-containing protein [Pedobacter sp. HDW13]|uniref:DUF4397 domain-containing protein n=1 Tax=unclassified Pedobacter TaxID=2628915 RepID=UPI000F5A95B3|nr:MULTISPECIES: DUF4397 domain-containing protein [unclassified Pedobacter]QIL41356.1 DUF4397 domain-containing protein [Pedobacter sp. HDW13]RQO78070.1 hypothetical protein DBR40_08970 [Pedobacter sp. KBW01]
MKFLKNINQLKYLTFTNKLVLAASILIAVLPSCKKTEYLDTDNADREPLSAKVKLVNALSITAPVNFLDFTRQINTTLVAHNVATTYLDTQFGKVQYNTTEGSNTSYKSSYIFGGAASFAQETDKASFAGPNGPIASYYHTLFTVAKRKPSKLNPGNRDSLVLVYDDLTAPAAGKAKIRFANFSPDAPNLDLKTTGGTSWFANVAYGNFGDQVQLSYDANGKAPATISGLSWKTLGPFKEIAAGAAQNLELRNNSTGTLVPVKTAALSNLNFEEGKIYTLFINGNLATDAALQATLIVHTK